MRKFFSSCRNPEDPHVIGLARDMTGRDNDGDDNEVHVDALHRRKGHGRRR
jgi:hypothetical protein